MPPVPPVPPVPPGAAVPVVLEMPAVAVTVAWTDVVSVVTAVPDASVETLVAPSVPPVVVKTTGTDPSALPLMSRTDAVMVAVPP